VSLAQSRVTVFSLNCRTMPRRPRIHFSETSTGKEHLDRVIDASRIYMYKPIHVAEVLYHFREGIDLPEGADVEHLESYRNRSKTWRNSVTDRLSGHHSTSSSRYQDDVFNDNAVPPSAMADLAKHNDAVPGQVERYIYLKYAEKVSRVSGARQYISSHGTSTASPFQLGTFMDLFIRTPGLGTSVDKAYEIVVFSLFTAIVRYAKLDITLTVNKARVGALRDFGDFAKAVLGLEPGESQRTLNGNIFRIGATNAADGGVDMWANFGPAIQVKHITLSPEVYREATTKVQADEIILVCKRLDVEAVNYLLQQTGNSKVRSVVSEEQLVKWYEVAMSKYGDTIGRDTLVYINREFAREFPPNHEVEELLEERGYPKINPEATWRTDIDGVT